MKRLWHKFLAFFAPFAAVALALDRLANEVKILRELYEMELGARTPPLVRVTEDPGKKDTIVTYTVDEDEDNPKSKAQQLVDDWTDI